MYKFSQSHLPVVPCRYAVTDFDVKRDKIHTNRIHPLLRCWLRNEWMCVECSEDLAWLSYELHTRRAAHFIEQSLINMNIIHPCCHLISRSHFHSLLLYFFVIVSNEKICCYIHRLVYATHWTSFICHIRIYLSIWAFLFAWVIRYWPNWWEATFAFVIVYRINQRNTNIFGATRKKTYTIMENGVFWSMKFIEKLGRSIFMD